MKIAVRGMGNADFVRRLVAAGITDLVGGIHNDMFFDAHWPSSDLEEFLRKSAECGRFDLNPWMQFTAREINDSRFVSIRPRKIVTESDSEYQAMRRDIDKLPWIGSDPLHRCRLPERIMLSHIKLKPNQAGVVGHWSVEFIVPDLVRTALETAGVTGVEFRPVLRGSNGPPRDDFHHLYAHRLLEPRVIDLSSPEIESALPEERGYDVLGSYCYEPAVLDQALDFNRTGESNVSFEFPDWIVSGRVRDVFAAGKLTGWAFEPVFEAGTEPYERYIELWTSFFDMIANIGQHTVGCRSL